MDYLEGLLGRRSVPLLTEPAPTSVQLEVMLQAALRAPDHGNLKPYRFLTIQGDARHALGQIFLQQQLIRKPDTNSFTQTKVQHMPLRAPMLVCLIACPVVHDKIPALEQIQATACAGQNILHAAYSQGLGAMWRTGWVVQDAVVRKHLDIVGTEELLGFIYIGTPKLADDSLPKLAPVPPLSRFVKSWQGKQGKYTNLSE